MRKDFADSYVERMRGVEWDAEGRFSVIETKARRGLPKLAIFNVYLVNGTDHAYKDPVTSNVAGTRHKRKLAVHKSLAEECHRLIKTGFQIIIAGDCNIARTEKDGHPGLRTHPVQHTINRQDFYKWFFASPRVTAKGLDVHTEAADCEPSAPGLGMIDTFRALHPEEERYSFYPRGAPFGSSCDRVDMILCSPALALHCKSASILNTPGDRASSDHVPIYAAFAFCEPDEIA